MPIDRDFLHEYAKNPQVQQAASVPQQALNLTRKIEHFPIVVEGVEFL
jgi:hypothetical protein